jgi:metal-responsive CopG/Arc/MetJ family transcriptional regulator
MKEKTSVTLSRDVLAKIDRLAGRKYSRSALIERVLREYLTQRERAAMNARDLEILNREADRLNAEAEDALQYQADEAGFEFE